MDGVRVGFLGYGEVGYHFARGFAGNGLRAIAAYSPSAARADVPEPLRRRAETAGVALVDTPRALCERSDLIVCVVPGRAALQALRSVRPFLRPEQLYVDATTGAVSSMERGERLLRGVAGYADAAIMGSVPLSGLDTVVVASGPQAARFRDLLAPYGLKVQVLPGKAGTATAMKLIRSVAMKGLAAVLIEALEAAQRHGILHEVAHSLSVSMDERAFEQIMKRYVCGTAVHAERRVHEMTEAVALLRAAGGSSRMTRATRAKLTDVAALGLRERFGGREPADIQAMIAALVAATP